MLNINDILNEMTPISLDEMSAVKLMNRVDTKYVADDLTVAKLFSLIKDDYYVQEIDGKRVAEYDSIYYDTVDNHMYIIHIMMKRNISSEEYKCTSDHLN